MKNLFFPMMLMLVVTACRAQEPIAREIPAYGFEKCIELNNGDCKVIIDPNLGGRVLAYEINGVNMLYTDESQYGKTWNEGDEYFEPMGGRFDFGPSQVLPGRRYFSFMGAWDAEITGELSARLTSTVDSIFEVQLIRDFTLAPDGSKLTCTQTIKNISNKTKHLCYWGRTFAKGGGISITPMNPNSRLPKGYTQFYTKGEKAGTIAKEPEDDPAVKRIGDYLEIHPNPVEAKFVMDSNAGWLAYISPENQLFVKKYKVYGNRQYGDFMGTEVSIWYKNDQMCEIEPFGPMEEMAPGESSSFTEDWYLVDYSYDEYLKTGPGKVDELVKTLE